jgi:hypothetical protein
LALAALAGLAALLGGCAAIRRELPVMLYVAVSVQDETNLTSDNAALFRQRFNLLVRDFQRLHPNVLVQLSLYPEDQLRKHLQIRARAGLGPDLVFTGADSATSLLQAGLVDPIPETPELRNDSSPALMARVRNRQGQVAGQPIILFPQLACYDKRQLRQPPTTLSGLPVGLAMETRQLVWTAGAFGAIPGLTDAALGRQPTPLDRARIRSWFAWLQQASDQQRVSFMPTQTDLRHGLSRGSLAWVSCSSGDLDLLRRTLGPHLGVTTLPNGPAHAASPVNRLRVLALGRNSSAAQRDMSLKLIQFSVGPLVQRGFTLDTLSFLPTNPHVSIPVQSSGVLAAMVQARQQARGAELLLADVHQDDTRMLEVEKQVMVPVLFGLLEPDLATERLIAILRRPQ